MGPEIYSRFIAAAGGPNALIIDVPTAGGDTVYTQDAPGTRGWRTAGAKNLYVLHTTDRIATVVGDDVTIGHGAVLEGCTIERGALVGMNAVVLHEAVVGAEALIGAGSKIPPRTLAAGSPCRVRKPLEGVAAQWITRAGPAYVRLSRRYLEEHGPIALPVNGPVSLRLRGAERRGVNDRASEGPVPG